MNPTMRYALVDAFLDSYQHIQHCRQQLDALDTPAPVADSDAKDEAADPTPHWLRLKLTQIQQQLSNIIAQLGQGKTLTQSERAVLPVLRYALAALVDEQLLYCLAWKGQDQWQGYLVEQQLFNSTTAGRALFQRMERLGDSSADLQVQQQLLHSYLLCLALGFEGEWRGQPARLKQVRQHLAEHLLKLQTLSNPQGQAQQDPFAHCAFAQAYHHAQANRQGVRLAPMRRWWLGCLLGLGLYLLCALALWYHGLQGFNTLLVAR